MENVLLGNVHIMMPYAKCKYLTILYLYSDGQQEYNKTNEVTIYAPPSVTKERRMRKVRGEILSRPSYNTSNKGIG